MRLRPRARLALIRATEEALERRPDLTVAVVRSRLERSTRRPSQGRLDSRVVAARLMVRAIDVHPVLARRLVRLWLRRAAKGNAGERGPRQGRTLRRLLPGVAALVVLVALWPTLCVTQEDGPTSCQSAVFLPLPWGESADTWGMAVAVAAAALTLFVARRLLRQADGPS